jgi:RimJ/RimL family protein N-acetyltransferase
MTIEFPIGERLPAEQLARRATLPLKPAPVDLRGKVVRLRPLDLATDVATLHAVSNGEPYTLGNRSTGAYDPGTVVWRYLPGGPFRSAADLAAYLRPQVEAANGLAVCVLDAASGTPIGVVNYMNNSPADLKIELGGIWYGPIAQRTGANLEATYLLLRHAFVLGYRRLEWKCDALNERSRRSALRMGFCFEGIHEAHWIVKDRNRDTAWFRILEPEWPAVRAQLEALLRDLPAR